MLEWKNDRGNPSPGVSPLSLRPVWGQQPLTVGYFSRAAESSREDDHLLPVSQEAPDQTETGGEVV